MKVFLAADHAGFLLKEELKKFLDERGFETFDCGAFALNPEDDYPDFVERAAREVAKSKGSFSIVFGRSGAGEAIVANKIKGIRAVLGFSVENVRLAREHNDANVLSLGSRFVSYRQAKELVEVFLSTPFSGEERHKRRIEKIERIEEGM